ncbi:MAG: hypothetical protein H5U02_12515 [Clostridia bacterium]|nr:hypothetical protein [Clostridia bacterium]
MVWLLVFGYALITVWHVLVLRRKGAQREMWAFLALMAIAVAISLPMAMGLKLPSPTDAIIRLFTPLARWFLGI